MDFFLYSVSAEGECQWRKWMGSPVSASPVMDYLDPNDSSSLTIFIGSWTGAFDAINATDGTLLWSYMTRDHIYSSGKGLKKEEHLVWY